MQRFTWQDKFNTGIQLLDNQHKKLIKMITMLEDSIEKGNTEETIAIVIKSLVFYAKWHFAEEEKVMEKLGYTEIDIHKNYHKLFIEQLVGKLMALKEDRSISAYEIISMLKKWFVKHIMVEDRKIGQAYKTKISVPA